MSRAVVWTDDAFDDIDRIAAHIAVDNPAAADRVTERLFEAASALPEHPFVYRAGRTPDTREAVVLPNYLIIYRVETDTIRILNVLHASRQYPPL